MDIGTKQVISAQFVGRSEDEYGPFKGRDGETVHGFRRFLYLADDDLNVSEVRCRNDELYEAAGTLGLGHKVEATIELRARNNALEPELLALKKG